MLLLSTAAGIIIGIVTGLVPGLHVNLVATTLYTVSPVLLRYFSPLELASFIISLSVTHSFLDTVPSIYLGAPENENALAILPGQKMLLQGRAHQAVMITLLGTYGGLLTALLLIPLFIISSSIIYAFLKPYLLYLLILAVAFTLLRSGPVLWNVFLFFLSGALGLAVFSLPINEPLFPLLSGLFGVSGLILSFFENTQIPLQTIEEDIHLSFRELSRSLAGASVAVLSIQFLPGFGPAQGASLSGEIIKDTDDKGYLALVGAIGTMSVIFSLVTFYTLGKAKDGTIVVISHLMSITRTDLLVLITIFLIAGSVALVLTLVTSRIFARIMQHVNYRLMVMGVILGILLMTILLTGPIGVLVLLTATSIGLIAPLKGLARTHAMGALILPVILYLLL